MSNNGKSVLGVYSASCEVIRGKVKKVSTPKRGDLIFFKGTRHAGANHIGIVRKVEDGKVYTIEGNTSGGSEVVDNGGGVAKKSYDLKNTHILSYGRPAYTSSCTADMVVKVAAAEVGYLEKETNKNLNDKTKNAGDENYTKYGKWLGMNGQYWCASFVSWCFHTAFDS